MFFNHVLPDRIFVLTDQNLTYSQQKMSFWKKKSPIFGLGILLLKYRLLYHQELKQFFFYSPDTTPSSTPGKMITFLNFLEKKFIVTFLTGLVRICIFSLAFSCRRRKRSSSGT